MSLRSRLLAAAAAVVVLLLAVLLLIVDRQRSVLTDQIDEQLLTVSSAINRAQTADGALRLNPNSDPTSDPASDPGPPTGDFYLAVIAPDGSVIPLVRPVSDPAFAPDMDHVAERTTSTELSQRGDIDPVDPFTVAGATGNGQARAVVVPVQLGAEQAVVVVARSMDEIDEAQRQLTATAGLAVVAVASLLGLVLWWVDRLGLQPISRLTAAAEDVAAGTSDRRVEHPPLATETGRLGAAFNTMLDARQAAESRQRRFVADASHELRTPLTTLQGYTALYASGGLDDGDAIDDAMRRIGAEATRMSNLVEDLLTLAALDEGAAHRRRCLADPAPIDLSQLLLDGAGDAAAVQPERPIDTTGVAAGLVIEADRDLLIQALTAVTTNTLRHTAPAAGLMISATASETGNASGNTPEDGVVITIADRGHGVAPDQLPHLFDRFFRADTGRAGATGGRGLGLAIARSIIEAHRGAITAASEPGQGTFITIELPCRQ